MTNAVCNNINNIKVDKNAPYAVFLDIDGTLMSGGELPEENVRAIKAAQAAGHKILINTGRSYAFIPFDKLGEIKFDGICAGCGSYIMIGDKLVYSKAADHSFVKRAVELYLKLDKAVFFEGEGACFWVNPHKHKNANNMIGAGRYTCYELTSPEQMDGEFAGQRISKFTYWDSGMTEEEKNFWGEQLRVIEHPTYAESVLYGCDKAEAMKTALSHLGIDREHTISMGDSANDTEMLLYAAIPVAMGNATEDTKKICSYISTDAKDGGVARALYDILGL